MRITTLTLLGFLFALSLPVAAQEKAEAKPDEVKKDASTSEPDVAEPAPAKISAPPKTPVKAPEKFNVKFETSKGDFIIEVTRKWSPLGADQFYSLVKTGFYNEARFFRVLPGFVVQWGISGNPKATTNWRKPIKDDPVLESNKKGYITYAMGGKDTRTTQLFVNLQDNKRLDKMGFSPFGRVTKGFDVFTKLYSGYGPRASRRQSTIKSRGNEFLAEAFPELDYIKKAYVLPPAKADKEKPSEAKSAKSKP